MKKKAVKFTFLSESTIRANHWDFNPFLSRSLRKLLVAGVYYSQPIPRGKIYWNWTLLHDYLLNSDRPEHQVLIEEYIASQQKAV